MSEQARLKRLGLEHLANDPEALTQALLKRQQDFDQKVRDLQVLPVSQVSPHSRPGSPRP